MTFCLLLSYLNGYYINYGKRHRFITLLLSKNNKPMTLTSFTSESIEIESAKVRAFDYAIVILST